jgi:hypothetical protein
MSTLSQFLGGGGSNKLPLGIKDTAFYIDALIVGGGGGPALGNSGNASGGGRVVQVFNLLVEKNIIYNITVGGAGAGAGDNGRDSVFGSILAQGGGGVNKVGGSGGGNTGGGITTRAIFPTIGTYSVNDILSATNIISSGNDGGNGSALNTGGGGGAGSPGAAPGGFFGGNGGAGIVSTIKGPGPYFYGAGIGGGPGALGPGGNGDGAGGANTGTGGQSGVVVVAYPNTFALATTTGAPTLFSALNPLGANATRTGYHVYEFTGSGSIRFN